MNMWQRFKKWFVKKMIPSAETFAGIAADSITNGFNRYIGETTRQKVAMVSSVGVEATSLGNELTNMLADGKIDEGERDKVAVMLTPLFAKVLDTLR